MKVALDARYVQDHFPGIGRYTFHLIEALVCLPDGPQLTLLYNPALPDRRYSLPDLAARFPERVRLQSTAVRPFSLAEQWAFWSLARRNAFDLWHAPYYIRPYFLPLPTVLTAYDVTGTRLPEALPSRKARLAFNLANRLAFRTSRRIIAISEFTASDIQRYYGVKPGKMRVIPLGVSSRFKPLDLSEQQVARARLRLPERYLLYTGINKPHKNLSRLLEAYRLYREQSGDDINLILAGKEDARYSKDLRKQVADSGLERAVRFRGEVAEEDLPSLYACATLFIFPSLYEGFGLPVLEALACGVPVACANNTSLPEVAGEAAILFEAENVAAIAEAIGEGLQPARQAVLRHKGPEQASKFSWQRTAELTLAVYNEIAAGK
ncbi:MAG TPA: glycosyltransferase family 1 protein [Chloroflexia bacterium]|nr:glycosyltransferase family 1 protein [Chloroflexia bacterium]